ncbi:transcription factor E2F5 isoform X1 [Paramormyrops kingsleyae]|uniref:transcription factor E2F5 isoform X1 n=1 Tax=Paramormyrops kingsleyae TaxID=1676925 RepID=UPI000CD61A3D|nr:transcription factor E2F5 isoform X1 [Paramormyrops kingsleyae]
MAGALSCVPVGTSRHEKSLGLLTIKFVSLLQEAEDGVLDLKAAADILAVRQKRRIYDITNVLEGVGLIEKKTKNIIQWKGENSGCHTKEALDQVELLRAQISELVLKEEELDSQKSWLQQSINYLSDDPVDSKFKYVTHEDICNAFNGDNLLAVIAPSGTQLEVPMPEMGHNGQKKYQVNLRSSSAPIHVLLINRETSSSKPVVFSVPPPDDISAVPTPPDTPASLPKSSVDLRTPSDRKVSLADPQLTSAPAADVHIDCTPQSPVYPLMPEPMTCAGVVTETGVADLIDELMSLDVFPLLRLSPAPTADYNFNLDDNEGVCDLFDVQILNY